jgi:hypothetical protein
MKQKYIAELVRCTNDCAYFINRYCYVLNPVKGKTLAVMWPSQVAQLKELQKPILSYSINKRQTGKTTGIAAKALWDVVFHDDTKSLVMGHSLDSGRDIIARATYMYENLPTWMKISPKLMTKDRLTFANGSSIFRNLDSRSDANNAYLDEFTYYTGRISELAHAVVGMSALNEINCSLVSSWEDPL